MVRLTDGGGTTVIPGRGLLTRLRRGIVAGAAAGDRGGLARRSGHDVALPPLSPQLAVQGAAGPDQGRRRCQIVVAAHHGGATERTVGG